MKVGDKIETWFSDSPDGQSTVLAIEPYRGKYTQDFTHVLRVTAPRTRRGWLEIPVCICPRVAARVSCDECGYPLCEANQDQSERPDLRHVG